MDGHDDQQRSGLRILYCGAPTGNSGSRVEGMRELGHRVEFAFKRDPIVHTWRLLRWIEWRACNGPVTWTMNRRLLQRAVEVRPDLVWVEMGRLVYARTLRRIREACGSIMVNSYSDDFLDPMKVSRHYNESIPLYDHIFTPREINFPELRQRGAKHVHRFWKGYNPTILYPETLQGEARRVYGTDVVFVGHCEPSRIEPFTRLAEAVGDFKIWGQGWERYRLPDVLRRGVQFRKAWADEYRKALCGAKIGLQYLSRWARDSQASRSFEIPACGVFMLADRTDDHLACFEEDKEAAFFSSTEEMVEKARFYLSHDDLRNRIARAGLERCIKSGYSTYARVRAMLGVVLDGRTGRSRPDH